MKKEKFLFELIQNYSHIASLGWIMVENYFLEDKTDDYILCAKNMEKCLKFYDHIQEKLDSEAYSQQEADAQLNFLIQGLKQETLRTIYTKMETGIKKYVPDSDIFLNESRKMLLDSSGTLTEGSVKKFMEYLRGREEAKTLEIN